MKEIAMAAWLQRIWPLKPRLPKPILVRTPETLELRFAHGVGQSRMALADPDALLIGYTRTMLAALLLQPAPRRIGMVGLGGGSQVKFCHRHLPDAHLEVMEINPRVIALRKRFGIPDDDARLEVRLCDAAAHLPTRRGAYDLLLIDGYDRKGIPEALCTQAFYRDCHAALGSDGALASNLYGSQFNTHLQRLKNVFGANVLSLDEPQQGNRVVFAWKGALPDDEAVMARISQQPRRLLQPELQRLGSALENWRGSDGRA